MACCHGPRAMVDVTTEGADQLIDQLAKKYLNEETYPFRGLSKYASP